MDIDLLYERFLAAKNSDEICECVIEALKIRETVSNEKAQKLDEILLHSDIPVYETMKMLHQKNYERAEFLIYTIVNQMKINQIPKEAFIIHYLLGRVNYCLGNYERAAKFFGLQDVLRMETWQDIDELSFFYRANCLAMLGNFESAAEIYETVLTVKSDFPEVQKNLELVKQNSNENLVMEVSSLWNFCDWQDVPIFINARDRVGVMKKLIDRLLDAGYRNLIILDNNSTYKKLLKYYKELEKDARVKVIFLKKNFGYKAIWESKILETLKISTPYIYTDPDVVPAENCPKDFVKKLYKLLDDNHELRKVGLGLIYDDVTFFGKEQTFKREETYCKDGNIGDNISYAQVDTTFALYANLRSYSLRFSLRTYGDFVARHLPWYFDYDNLPADEKYYMEHANKNSITSVNAEIINAD